MPSHIQRNSKLEARSLVRYLRAIELLKLKTHEGKLMLEMGDEAS